MKTLQLLDTKCQSCDSRLVRILDLGDQPICNAFSKKPDGPVERYPLRLAFCPECSLVQLEEVPPASVVFGKGFNYLTGSTSDAVSYFHRLAESLASHLNLAEGDMVLDIGSNDGTFLHGFKKQGLEVLGVDPAPRPVKIANAAGIDTICAPFEDAVPEILQATGKRLRLVTAFNVIAHTDRIHEFLDAVHLLCERTGAIFVSQSHYLPSLIQRAEWDTVYHEHARYYTVSSLDRLLWRHRLKLFDSDLSPYYGGSFLAFASHLWYRRTGRLLHQEATESAYREAGAYRALEARVARNRAELRYLLYSLKEKGKRVIGIGAPMKSATLLNHCGIGPGLLDYLTENNPLKVGTFSPGVHIPVVPDGQVFRDRPDYALILAWNVADRIISDFRANGFEGRFMLPNPEVRVLD